MNSKPVEDEGIETKPVEDEGTGAKLAVLEALATGSHAIGDATYTFNKGDILHVPKAHYDSMKTLPHMKGVE